MSHQEAFTFAKLFLRSLSDRTFLSSISYIDFEHQYISIRRNFWKTLLGFVFTRLPITFQRNTRIQICSSLKTLFIERYSEVSANMLKSFMLSTVKNSFLDFKNIMHYMLDYYRNGNPFRKKFKLLRQQYYFERKAKKYYLRQLNADYIEPAQATQDYVPDVSPQHEHVDQPEEDVISDIYMSDIDYSESSTSNDHLDHFQPIVVTESENVDRLQRQINGFHPHNYETEASYNTALAKLRELDGRLRSQCTWPEILPYSSPPIPFFVDDLFRPNDDEGESSNHTTSFNNSLLADNTNSEPIGTFVRPDGSWVSSTLDMSFVNGEASASVTTNIIRGAIQSNDDDDEEGFYF